MDIGSGLLLHIGINFLTVPAPAITPRHSLTLQQAILNSGLEFSKLENPKNQIKLMRDNPSPLQVTVGILEGAPVGQLLIIAPNPQSDTELFIKEAEAVAEAYQTVWPIEHRHIIKCDGAVRKLYQTTAPHAFQELWEQRLGQSAQSLAAFGKPIRGGGLRFVMDPVPSEIEPIQVEVKIESYLQDSSKVFMETLFNWVKQSEAGVPFNIRERITSMTSYVGNEVQAFLSGGQ